METGRALVVVPGKQPEREPTARTTWMPPSAQLLGQVDAGWELCRSCAVYRPMIVDSAEADPEAAAESRRSYPAT